MQRFFSRAAVPALVLALAAACGENPGATEPVVGQGPASFVIVSGNDQTGAAGEELAQPIVVRAEDASGNPVPGRHIGFRVVAGGGEMFVGGGVTDANGIVKDYWTLGTVALDSQRIEARSVDPATGAKQVFGVFRATSIAGAPVRTVALTTMPGPNGWVQPVRSLVLDSVRVGVLDRFGNRVMQSGIAVQWTASNGGNISVSSGTVNTNAQGVAATQWRLGTTLGAQTLSTSVAGSTPLVSYKAYGLPGVAAFASFSADSVHLTAGREVAPLAVTATDAYGNAVAYTLSSQDPTIVMLDSLNRFIALKDGKTRVILMSGSKADTAIVTVKRMVAVIQFRTITSTLRVGGTIPMYWATVLRDANNFTIANGTGIWTTTNPAVASASPDGTVTAHAPGTFKIIVSRDGVTRETHTITVTS